MTLRDGVRRESSFQRLERTARFEGRVVGVSVDKIVLPNGNAMNQEVVHLPSAVCIVPLLTVAGGGVEVVLVEQFRGPLSGYIHEVPAGILEEGEEPGMCAARELEEETGYRSGRVAHLTTLYPSPGVSDHQMHFFVADQLAEGEQQLECAECLTVKRVPLRDLVGSILRPSAHKCGQPSAEPGAMIVDTKTQLALMHVVMRGICGSVEDLIQGTST